MHQQPTALAAMPSDFYAVRVQTDRLLALLLMPALGVSVLHTCWFVCKLLLLQAHALRNIRRHLASCRGQCDAQWESCLPSIAKEVAGVRDLLLSTNARLDGVRCVRFLAPAVGSAAHAWDDYTETLAVSSDPESLTLVERVAHVA